uniref:GDNF/GAS1 domain-containing protein n=1 Tax=Xiphophorus couchianus TaxID=32473 RepID=A0A3B5MEQ7_9TELE
MCFCVFLVLLAVLVPMANESQGSPGTRFTREAQSQWVDCIQASEMCSQDSRCSPRYRVMRQCLVGKEKDAMLDNNRDCKAALEVLHNSSLYDCRCKRAMKNELQCLQNYWTIHMGLNEGREQIEGQVHMSMLVMPNYSLNETRSFLSVCPILLSQWDVVPYAYLIRAAPSVVFCCCM